MRVLSLFDGMSCGQIAINKLGIKDYTYYASEIDKYAISITQKNFPNTILFAILPEAYLEKQLRLDLTQLVHKLDLLLQEIFFLLS